MKWIVTGGLVGLAAFLVGLGVFLARDASRPRVEYPMDTPEATLESAWRMVEDKSADRLAELLYGDSDEMKAVLARLGRLFGNLQTLAEEVNAKFPSEVADLRTKALEKGAGLDAVLSGAGGRNGGRVDRREAERRSQDLFKLLLADPFGWIEANRSRVTVVKMTDDTAAVQVDGKPAFGIGLAMKRDEDGWKVVPPLTLPVVTKYLPRDHNEWQIVASLVLVFDNAVLELTGDVRAGKALNVQEVVRLAGEKAAVPAIICFIAYSRAIEAREREAKTDAKP